MVNSLVAYCVELEKLDSKPSKAFDLASALAELDRAILDCFEITAGKIPKHLRDGRFKSMSLAQLESKRLQILQRNIEAAQSLVEVDDAVGARAYLIGQGIEPDRAARIVEQAETRKAIADHDERKRAERIKRMAESVSKNPEGLEYEEQRVALDGLRRLLGQLPE
jgi:hypothetical protein